MVSPPFPGASKEQEAESPPCQTGTPIPGGLATFTSSDQEKRQLEEIAHLYFSDPEAPPPEGRVEGVGPAADAAFGFAEKTLAVCCTAGAVGAPEARWFLFNLGVTLRILSEPVLLVCSDHAYRHRFSFGFRPDRERPGNPEAGRPLPFCFGPMGVCLVEGRSLFSGGLPGIGSGPAVPAPGSLPPYRYVLSDVPLPWSPALGAQRLLLFLVTPETANDAFVQITDADEAAALEGVDHAGLVVVGADDGDQADRVGRSWRKRLSTLLPDRLAPAACGSVVLDSPGGRAGAGSRIEALERPTGGASRCYRATACTLMRWREELFAGVS